MKVYGIISEYNPFHNGHIYQIEETKKRTGATHIVAVMSGNFVQRGEPALIDKFKRAQIAVKNGAAAKLRRYGSSEGTPSKNYVMRYKY